MYEKSKNWINEQIKDRNKSFLVDQKCNKWTIREDIL